MVDDREDFVGVAVTQVRVLRLGQDGGNFLGSLVIQLDLSAALPHGQDVDVRVEAEAERLSLVPEGGLELATVVIPGPEILNINWRHFDVNSQL